MTDRRARLEAAGLLCSFAGVGAVAGTSSALTGRNRDWYAGLRQPPAAPPPQAVAPVCSLLYAGQAVAGWLVWRDDARRGGYDVPAMAAYAVQLALGGVWVLLFFGLHRPALALVEVCVLWVALAITVREFARRHRGAASLLVPSLVAATYAGYLTAGLWWRNRR